MASVIERRGSEIIYKSPNKLDIPNLDILTFLFDNPHNDKLKQDTVIHADAADPSKCVTKAGQVAMLKRLAHTLRSHYGIGEGDVVQVLFTGHYLAPTVFHAVIASGAAIAASTPSASPAELARQIALTHSKLLICSPDIRPLAVDGGTRAGLTANRILSISDGALDDRSSLNVLLSLHQADSGARVPLSDHEHPWRRITSPRELASTTACLIYSSGTTGVPKAVQITHANVVAQAYLILAPTIAYNDHEEPSFEYRTLAHLPAAHISGLQAYFVNQTHLGGVVFWMPRFDFAQFLRRCRDRRITMFFSVPPVFLAIAKSPLVTDQLDSVSVAMTGAAAMGKDVQAAARSKIGRGNAILGQTWGLSETTGGFTAQPRDQEEDDTGSVSMIIANCEARIVDEQGRDVEPGQVGEMWVKGPIVTKGYFNNDKANQEAFVDGWFRTGDNLYFKDGKFYYVDRKKEILKYKGFQVAPAELEALLLTHPEIQDAAVIGVESEGNELPRAYVVADESKVSGSEIAKWVAGQVASYKQLRGGVIFTKTIPKSPSGKILRKELRAAANKESTPKL